jgi:hypothetical protein
MRSTLDLLSDDGLLPFDCRGSLYLIRLLGVTVVDDEGGFSDGEMPAIKHR